MVVVDIPAVHMAVVPIFERFERGGRLSPGVGRQDILRAVGKTSGLGFLCRRLMVDATYYGGRAVAAVMCRY